MVSYRHSNFIQWELTWIRKSLERQEKKEEKEEKEDDFLNPRILDGLCPCGSHVRIDMCSGNKSVGETHSKGLYLLISKGKHK